MEMQELKDDTQVQNPQAEKTELSPEEKALQQQIGVITVIERLFRAVDGGTFPLRVHDDIMAGMNFMSQFHKQLVAQLPEETRTKLQAEAANVKA